jgi:hypothetical protein
MLMKLTAEMVTQETIEVALSLRGTYKGAMFLAFNLNGQDASLHTQQKYIYILPWVLLVNSGVAGRYWPAESVERIDTQVTQHMS